MNDSEKVKVYEVALRQILAIHERHVDEATMRRSRDFREAMEIARNALKETGEFPAM